MAENYTVRQGDHLSKIAKQYGFSDYHTIWDHPNNADLKQSRQNPNVLYPGDNLYIPDRELRTESRSTDQKHKFKAKNPNLKLRLVLEDLYEKPIAGAKCILTLSGDPKEFTTDAKGKIETEVDPKVHEGLLVILDTYTAFNDVPIPIKIGDLNPMDKPSGQVARLNNLGYFAGDPDHADDPDHRDDKAFESAVEEFQCDHGLKVDGKCGPITQSKLVQVHGC